MRLNERIRIGVLVGVLAVVGVAGEVAGDPVATSGVAAPVQAATIGVAASGVNGDTSTAMTTALWTLQLFGILMFEAWALGRRRWSATPPTASPVPTPCKSPAP